MARPREFDEEHVIDAVMNTFWRRGFLATSAQDLVDATGLGRGSLYNAFSNKSGLYEQALIRYKRQAAGYVKLLERDGTAREVIRDLLLNVIDIDLNDPTRRGCLVTNAAVELAGRDDRASTLVRENLQIVQKGIEAALRRGQQKEEIDPCKNIGIVASCIMNTMQGLRVLTKITPKADRQHLVDVVDLSLEILS